jgi:protein-S-isoprenylcysteine O-methyltransferase Ste14
VERFLQLCVLGALALLALLGVGRALLLAGRGVSVLAVDRQRRPAEALADLLFVLAFGLWAYETLAFSLPLGTHGLPGWARAVVLETPPARWAGVLALAAGLVVYASALCAFGASWRLGIDRDHPGPLVTRGIFERSRNPVYLALLLVTGGTFLVLGRLVLLLLALAFGVYFHTLVRREERFLCERYGEAYRAYAARVGRWWTFRRREDRPHVGKQ